MKKTLTVLALLAMSLGAFAQNTGKDVLDQLENKPAQEKKAPSKSSQKETKMFDFQLISYVGYGWHIIEAPEFNKGLKDINREVFVNAFEFDFCPTSWLSVCLGMDLSWQDFTPSAGNAFSKNANDEVIFAIAPAANEKMTSTLHSFGLAAPLTLGFNLGPASLALSAELTYTPAGRARIKDNYFVGASEYTVVTRQCNYSGFGWDLSATLSFGLLGVYVRYYPQQPVIPTAPFNLTTVGLVANLGSL